MQAKKYFTMFSFIYYGDPDGSVVKAKNVAEAISSGQAKYLCSILNEGLAARDRRRVAELR